MADPSSEAHVEPTDQDVNSESSTETEVQGVGSIHDAVNAALGEGKPEATPASEPGSKEPDPSKSEAEPELSEEEIQTYSQKTQRRIRELLEARRTAEGEVAPLRQELETIKPKAERMDQITEYMTRNNVKPEHLDNALGLTAIINRGEYDKALPMLEALLSQVKAAAGEVLPAHLQQRVDLGYITEADAKALHKAQTSEQRTREHSEQERARSEQERHERETQIVVDRAVNTAEAWNKEQVASDPDWNLKRDLVTERMELELRRLGPQGYPRTQEAVRTLLEKIKTDVEAGIKRFRPAPKAIVPSPTGGNASPRSTAKPASLMDAVNQALSTIE